MVRSISKNINNKENNIGKSIIIYTKMTYIKKLYVIAAARR